MMSRSSHLSSRDAQEEIDAAIAAISRFEQLNAEADQVLGQGELRRVEGQVEYKAEGVVEEPVDTDRNADGPGGETVDTSDANLDGHANGDLVEQSDHGHINTQNGHVDGREHSVEGHLEQRTNFEHTDSYDEAFSSELESSTSSKLDAVIHSVLTDAREAVSQHYPSTLHSVLPRSSSSRQTEESNTGAAGKQQVVGDLLDESIKSASVASSPLSYSPIHQEESEITSGQVGIVAEDSRDSPKEESATISARFDSATTSNVVKSGIAEQSAAIVSEVLRDSTSPKSANAPYSSPKDGLDEPEVAGKPEEFNFDNYRDSPWPEIDPSFLPAASTDPFIVPEKTEKLGGYISDPLGESALAETGTPVGHKEEIEISTEQAENISGPLRYSPEQESVASSTEKWDETIFIEDGAKIDDPFTDTDSESELESQDADDVHDVSQKKSILVKGDLLSDTVIDSKKDDEVSASLVVAHKQVTFSEFIQKRDSAAQDSESKLQQPESAFDDEETSSGTSESGELIETEPAEKSAAVDSYTETTYSNDRTVTSQKQFVHNNLEPGSEQKEKLVFHFNSHTDDSSLKGSDGKSVEISSKEFDLDNELSKLDALSSKLPEPSSQDDRNILEETKSAESVRWNTSATIVKSTYSRVESQSYSITEEASEQHSNSTAVDTSEQHSNSTAVDTSEQQSNYTAFEASDQPSFSTALDASEQYSNSTAVDTSEQNLNSTVVNISEQHSYYTAVDTSEPLLISTAVDTSKQHSISTTEDASEQHSYSTAVDESAQQSHYTTFEASEQHSSSTAVNAPEQPSISTALDASEQYSNSTAVDESEQHSNSTAVNISEQHSYHTAVDTAEPPLISTAVDTSKQHSSSTTEDASEQYSNSTAVSISEQHSYHTAVDTSEPPLISTAVDTSKQHSSSTTEDASEQYSNSTAVNISEQRSYYTAVDTSEPPLISTAVDTSGQHSYSTAVGESEQHSNSTAVNISEQHSYYTAVDTSEPHLISVDTSKQYSSSTTEDASEHHSYSTAVDASEQHSSSTAVDTSEQETSSKFEVESSTVWKAPRPIITSRPSSEDINILRRASPPVVENIAQDRAPLQDERPGQWRAPYPLVARNSFPLMTSEEKHSTREIAMKFEMHKAESSPNLNRTVGVAMIKTNAEESPDLEKNRDQGEDPKMSDLMERFQRLKSEDDLTSSTAVENATESSKAGVDVMAQLEDQAEKLTAEAETMRAEISSIVTQALSTKLDEKIEEEDEEEIAPSVSSGSEFNVNEVSEKTDIFSTQNTKFYRGYIDVDESSVTSDSTYTIEKEQLEKQVDNQVEEDVKDSEEAGSLVAKEKDRAGKWEEDAEGEGKTFESEVEGAQTEEALKKVEEGATDVAAQKTEKDDIEDKAHDSDWLSSGESAGEFFESDTESDYDEKSTGEAEITEKDGKESLEGAVGKTDVKSDKKEADSIQEVTVVVTKETLSFEKEVGVENEEEPKANVSSDFKSSLDTSVWSASEDDVLKSRDLEADDDNVEIEAKGPSEVEQTIIDADISEPSPLENKSSVLVTETSGVASVTSMFHVPPARVPEPEEVEAEFAVAGSTKEEREELHISDDVIEPAVEEENDISLVKSEDKVSDVRLAESEDKDALDEGDEVTEDKAGKRPKSGKVRRRSSITKRKESEEVEADEVDRTTERLRRRLAAPKRKKKVKAQDEAVEEITVEQDRKVEEVAVKEEEKEVKPRRRRKKKTSSAGFEATSGIAEETVEKVHEDERKRSKSHRKSREETVTEKLDKHEDVESLTTDTSERQSRRRHRKPPRLSETLYQTHPFTNQDMLDEKYVELFDIMRNDGIETRELVKEVGVVLARAGLSPRSPRVSPRSAPPGGKPKTAVKRDHRQEKFQPMPGVHVIPCNTSAPPETYEVPIELSRKHESSAEYSTDANSFERTQKKLYRKYHELNALLNRQLPDESAHLVEEQLEQTLHLLHRHYKQGRFNARPETQHPQPDVGQRTRGQSRRTKSVSFRERPASSHKGGPSRRSYDGKNTQKEESDSEGKSRSRSRSRSFSPTDCSLRNTKNPEVRLWLREKNKKLRKQKRAERLKELEEKRLQEAKNKEKEERDNESRKNVRKWFRQKHNEVRLLSRRKEEAGLKIKIESSGDTGGETEHIEEFGSLDSSRIEVPEKCVCGFVDASKLKEDADRMEKLGKRLKAGKLTTNYVYKRPVSAPAQSPGKTLPYVSKRKPLSATAENIATANKTGAKNTPHSVNAHSDCANGHSAECPGVTEEVQRTSTEQPKRPKSSKRRKKKENKDISEGSAKDDLKNRVSYDDWVKEKQRENLMKKKKEKEYKEQKLRESDPAMNSIVPDLARRRIRIIEGNKVRVDSGIRQIDDEANSYPRGSSAVTNGETDGYNLAGKTNEPTDAEERYQWKLEGEVKRPKSGKPAGKSEKVPTRPSSSPASKTRARARLTMPKSASSPRSRVEDISEKGPNPFKSPIPIVNASLKRSGDSRSRYAKKVWKDFSDDVWKQVNEEEGVNLGEKLGGHNGVDENEEGVHNRVDGVEEGALNGMESSEKSPESVSGSDAKVTSPSKPSSDPKVNFGGIVYTLDADGVVQDSSDPQKTQDQHSPPEPTVAEAPPGKKNVNFGGIVYSIDAKQDPIEDNDSEIIEEDIPDGSVDDDDDAGDGFFITSVEDERA